MGNTYNISTGGFSCGQQVRLEGLNISKEVITILELSVTEEFKVPTNDNNFDGFINLNINGGTEPYSVLWKDGYVGKTRTNLDYGEYVYTVSDYYGDMTHSNTIILEKEEEIVLENEIQQTITEYVEEIVNYDNLCLTDGKINYLFKHDGSNMMIWLNEENNFILQYVEENLRWEVTNWLDGRLIKNNGTFNKIPIGGDWNNNGKLWKLTKGDCKEIEDYINLSINDETCYGLRDGSVYIKVNSEVDNSGYKYRVKGVSPYPEYQESAVFNKLMGGDYIVEAKKEDKILTEKFKIDTKENKKFIKLNLNQKIIKGDTYNKTISYSIDSDHSIQDDLEIEVSIRMVHTKQYNIPNSNEKSQIEPVFDIEYNNFDFESSDTNTRMDCNGETTSVTVKHVLNQKIILNKENNNFNGSVIHGISTFDHTWADCECKAFAKSKVEMIISNVVVKNYSCFEVNYDGFVNNDIYLQDCIKQ